MQHMIERVQKEKPYRGIVGVPYAALPYATVSLVRAPLPSFASSNDAHRRAKELGVHWETPLG